MRMPTELQHEVVPPNSDVPCPAKADTREGDRHPDVIRHAKVPNYSQNYDRINTGFSFSESHYSPIEIQAGKYGPQVLIQHPDAGSPQVIVIDALGARCRSAAGEETLSPALLARNLAEWFRGTAGPIQGRSYPPEEFVQTGIADAVTISRLGQLEHIHLDTRGLLHVEPRQAGEGPLYQHTRINCAQLATLIAGWLAD